MNQERIVRGRDTTGIGEGHLPEAGFRVLPHTPDMTGRRPKENPFLPELTAVQIDSFIDLLEGYNRNLPVERQRKPADYIFLRHFYKGFVEDRNKRAAEVNDAEYQPVVELANSLLPLPTLGLFCMDGRVKLIHVFGFGAGIGSSIRAPGGLLNEFLRGEDGQIYLDPDSNFAQLLKSAFSKNGDIAEVFDSHWRCAARQGEEQGRGMQPEDGGLYSDVLHKKEMAQATREYCHERSPKKQAVMIQTTFNPVTGFLYMGLESDQSLEFARQFARQKAESQGLDPEQATPVYSKEVIKQLIEKGSVISTGQLLADSRIKSAFDNHHFDVGWKHAYVDSSKRFWGAIGSMKDQLLPVFEEYVAETYPRLAGRQQSKERVERAFLLMCNAYNGYLHNSNHNESDYLNMDDKEYEAERHYEYDTHIEEGIKVSEGGHPPYEIAMFVVFGKDRKKIPAWVELAANIVRDNRRQGRIVDRSGQYNSPEQFAQAPVPGVHERHTAEIKLIAEFKSQKSKVKSTSKNSKVVIKPGEFYLVKTVESVNMPENLTASITPRSTTYRSGLFIRTGNVPPGYCGGLTFGLKNEGPVPVTIELGARFVHIQFHEVRGAGNMYRGQWQGGRVTTRRRERQV